MRRWSSLPLAVLFVLGLSLPAWANSELHFGARLFFPLWDTSTANRLTFIIVTREALREGVAPFSTLQGTQNTSLVKWSVAASTGNCIPRGAGNSSENINRTDLIVTGPGPTFVDDYHIEYYGKSCISDNETVHMSCADIDLFLLSSAAPRAAFQGVVQDGMGAVDFHRVRNGTPGPERRYVENSIMGHAVISDIAEGWAATYPAAAAKATFCHTCDALGGSKVGYENYPMEAYIPFAFAEQFPVQGGGALRNLLSLWGPGLFPGDDLTNRTVNVQFKWWDGRERAFDGSRIRHSILAPLGGPSIPGFDAPLDTTFNIANFTCGHTGSGSVAENDGFPRNGNTSTTCTTPLATPDPDHKSDNFESTTTRIQSSTPISWWRFRMLRDGNPPVGGPPNFVHSGRGLVGVVLSSTPGVPTASQGIGDATRLWHKDPCGTAQSNETFGPPHVQNGRVWESAKDTQTGAGVAPGQFNLNSGFGAGDLVSWFNIFSRDASSNARFDGDGIQDHICDGDSVDESNPGLASDVLNTFGRQ